MPCLADVHRCDRVVHAAYAKPLLAAWIAIEPVGVDNPLGAIGGVVEVHESLSCTHNNDQYTIVWCFARSTRERTTASTILLSLFWLHTGRNY